MLLVAKFSSHDSASDMKMEVMTTATTCRITIREMIDLHLDLGAPFRELLAQAVDIYLDGVRGDFSRMAEDVIFDLLLGHHPALAAHQQLEHRDFAGREHLGLVVDRRLPGARGKRSSFSGVELSGTEQRGVAISTGSCPPQYASRSLLESTCVFFFATRILTS